MYVFSLASPFSRLPFLHSLLLCKKRPGAQTTGLQHVISLNHARQVSIPRRAAPVAAAAAVVETTGRARRGLGLGLDDEEGVGPTEDVVVDSHPVQVLLDGQLLVKNEE